MSSLAKVILIGNLGHDPETRSTTAGRAVTTFSLAVNTHSGTGEDRKEATEWFRVSAWNKLAETCSQYLRKGSKAYVEGRLRSRIWTGQDGQQHFEMDVDAETVVLLDGKAAAPNDDPPF